MGKKVNVSLSLKLTIIVVVITTIIVGSVSFINYHFFNANYEDVFFEDPHFQTATSLVQGINATIDSSEDLHNRTFLDKEISKFLVGTPEDLRQNILQININLLDEQDKLVVFYSTDENIIDTESNLYIRDVAGNTISCNEECLKNNIYFLPEHSGNSHVLTILSPINLSGEVEGTYEIKLSMDLAYNTFQSLSENRISWVVFLSVVCLFIFLFILLFLLRRLIVKPIIDFRKTAKVFGTGNLDARVDINTKDELGDLAKTFNQMAKDLKDSRDKVEDYNSILENLLDRKDEFIGQLGHDLKNPLQPLIGLLPTLVEQEKDPKKKEALQIMSRNAEYMKDLIYNTLQLAKLRSETIEFDIEDLNLKAESDDVIETQGLLLKEKDISVENKIPKNIIVKADKLRLAEVFKNLITNSIKYTANGGGKITLDAKQEENKVTVSVKDTGIGMTHEQIKKVFDEFYKADKASSEYASTGLGLAICKRIVEKLDGKIWVDSEGHGKGSTFYFTLKSKAKNN